ncbi:MAG: glycosyltransferase family 2 protein [Pseudomonas sp.]
MAKIKAACIIPTYNGGSDLVRLMASLNKQNLSHDILVVDSSSVDKTRIHAIAGGADTITISPVDFNHGGTRQMMVDKHPNYDVYIFLTQDAYLSSPDTLQRLLSHFDNPLVGAVCGRQLPHVNAGLLASHARIFNYPDVPSVRSISDKAVYGIKTPFISNSFCAYRKSSLTDAGGFPKHVILSEDMYVASKMLLDGWQICYANDASCLHSHDYTMLEEFKRYFDQGVFHSREKWIGDVFGGASGEGFKFVKSELNYLGFSNLHYWPYAISRNIIKFLGYRLGKMEKHIPTALKKKISMHSRYWDSPYAEMH